MEAGEPFAYRVVLFVATLGIVLMLTVLTIAYSKRLAEALDILSDQRTGWSEKWREFRASAGSSPRRRVAAGTEADRRAAAADGGGTRRTTFGV